MALLSRSLLIDFLLAHERLLRMSRSMQAEEQVAQIANSDEVLEILDHYRQATLPRLPEESFTLSMPFEHKALSFQLPVGIDSPRYAPGFSHTHTERRCCRQSDR